MQQALPYKAWHTSPTTTLPRASPSSSSNPTVLKRRANLKTIVDENTVTVFAQSGCCMTHVVRRLLLGLGVNPTVYDIDDEQYVVDELRKLGVEGGGGMSFPAVFIGGRWFGGLDRLIATHISGELTPLLREAGALWL